MGFSLQLRSGMRGALPLALLIVLAGCEAAPAPSTRAAAVRDSAVAAVDDAGRTVRLPRPARRVVSLLPAGTETFLAIGALDRLVGRTRYDEDPRTAALPSVGGGLDPSLEALLALRPDLVVAFETASTSKVRTRLEALGVPVFAIQAQDTADVYRNIRGLGRLVGRAAAADSVMASIRAELDSVRASVPPGPRPRVLYVASVDPPMMAGSRTYIAELLSVAGAAPVTAEGDGSYWPRISLEELVRREPDVVMLPVGEEDPTASVARLKTEPGWRDLRAVREGRVAVVDADLMNRPGPRIGETARRMRAALDRVAER